MKIVLVMFSIVASINTRVSGQLFGEKVTIYGVTLKAKDITGQKRFSSTSQAHRTSLLSPLVEKRDKEYLFGLGSFRRHKRGEMETLDLFNMSFYNNSAPLLDSIDFHFYESQGFGIVALRNPNLAANPLFSQLKNTLSDTKFTSDKKHILFKPIYDVVRNELILSRFDIITKSFTLGKKKVTTSTSDLKARLDSVLLGNGIGLSAEIGAYLHGLADEKLDLVGTYYDARLSDSYISAINYFIANTNIIHVGNDMFAFYLKEYINSSTKAANSGLVAIQLSGTYDKTKIDKDSIAFTLHTKFKIPAQSAIKIGASIRHTFTKDETINLKTQFNSVFILRYFTSQVIDEVKFPSIRTIAFVDLTTLQANTGIR